MNGSNKGNVIPTPAKLLCKCADVSRQRSHGLRIPLFLIENLQQKESSVFSPLTFLILTTSPIDTQGHTCLRGTDPAELAGATESQWQGSD